MKLRFPVLCCIISLIFFGGCTKFEKDFNDPNIGELTVLKTINYLDSTHNISLEIQVYNQDLLDLSENDFKIRPKQVNFDELSGQNYEVDSITSNKEISKEDPDFQVKLLSLPSSFNAIDIDLLYNSNFRGRFPRNVLIVGRQGDCGDSDAMRVRGFIGTPYDCNHHHWKWSKKTSAWNATYQQLYSGTSYNGQDLIGFVDLNMDHPKFKLRLDPDQSCDDYGRFTLVVTPC